MRTTERILCITVRVRTRRKQNNEIYHGHDRAQYRTSWFGKIWYISCFFPPAELVIRRTVVTNHKRPQTNFSSFKSEFLVDVNQMFPWQYWGLFSRRGWWNISLREDVGVPTLFAGFYSTFQYAWCWFPGKNPAKSVGTPRSSRKLIFHQPRREKKPQYCHGNIWLTFTKNSLSKEKKSFEDACD